MAYVDKDYVYSVARVRVAETRLLNSQALSRLLESPGLEDAIKFLKDRGWGKGSDDTPEGLLGEERERLWDFIAEIVPDISVFDVFRLPNDYNNLKAAIRSIGQKETGDGIFIRECTVDPELIKEAVSERRFDLLPSHMRMAAQEALSEFLKARDGQICDIICDRACLEAMEEIAKECGDSFLLSYARSFCACTDIRIAMRSARTGKTRDFLALSIAQNDLLDKKGLIDAAMAGIEGIASFLLTTPFAAAADILRRSPSGLERWCDDYITENSRKELMEYFGIGPIAAYILAKENEIKSVRILLSGKLNGFPQSIIRERMRASYV